MAIPIALISIHLLAAAAGIAADAPVQNAAANDAVFAPKGHFSVSAATGIPHVAIGEVAYGVTRWFTVGASQRIEG